ncbi:hypothetical protein AAFF_G00178480 [Aldrovandia affinis]|uniref:Uncharacterized protein n=1 Tax=Aldrovandia affinis TaxID=143900 RepID=A0AAD7RKX7_9TELE|nr:hypothetical protein AAFF_G00178480 [Aldrovandia affinis]
MAAIAQVRAQTPVLSHLEYRTATFPRLLTPQRLPEPRRRTPAAKSVSSPLTCSNSTPPLLHLRWLLIRAWIRGTPVSLSHQQRPYIPASPLLSRHHRQHWPAHVSTPDNLSGCAPFQLRPPLSEPPSSPVRKNYGFQLQLNAPAPTPSL